MYYYIAQPPQSKGDQATISAIRAKIIPEGIPGEFVFRSPGSSAAQLAQTALNQGFTTICCIGDDQMISEVASVLYDTPVALGILPMNTSAEMCESIGYTDWKTGLTALRQRKLVLKDLGSVNGDACFLTSVSVRAPKRTNYHLHMDRFAVTIPAQTLQISLPSPTPWFSIAGVINFMALDNPSQSPITKGWLGKEKLNIDTLVRAEQAVIQSDNDEAGVYYQQTKIADLPATFTVIPQAVRLIVAKQTR